MSLKRYSNSFVLASNYLVNTKDTNKDENPFILSGNRTTSTDLHYPLCLLLVRVARDWEKSGKKDFHTCTVKSRGILSCCRKLFFCIDKAILFHSAQSVKIALQSGKSQ